MGDHIWGIETWRSFKGPSRVLILLLINIRFILTNLVPVLVLVSNDFRALKHRISLKLDPEKKIKLGGFIQIVVRMVARGGLGFCGWWDGRWYTPILIIITTKINFRIYRIIKTTNIMVTYIWIYLLFIWVMSNDTWFYSLVGFFSFLVFSSWRTFCCCSDDNKINMVRKRAKTQKENPAGCAKEGNRVKEISRREKHGLLRQLHFVMKSREEGVRWVNGVWGNVGKE